MPDLNDLKKLADQHDEQVDQGIGKAGDAAGAKLGHEKQIDEGVDKIQASTGSGDTAN